MDSSDTRVSVVKPLVWEKLSDNCYRAKLPLIGNLRVETYGGDEWFILWSIPGYCETFTPGTFKNADDAKAAAQSDFTARIQSQLIATPSDTAEVRNDAFDAAKIKRLGKLIHKIGTDMDALRAMAKEAQSND